MDHETNTLMTFVAVAIPQLQRLFRSSCVICILPDKWKRVQQLVNLRRGTQNANGVPRTVFFLRASMSRGKGWFPAIFHKPQGFPWNPWRFSKTFGLSGWHLEAEEFDIPCPGGRVCRIRQKGVWSWNCMFIYWFFVYVYPLAHWHLIRFESISTHHFCSELLNRSDMLWNCEVVWNSCLEPDRPHLLWVVTTTHTHS